MFREMRLTLADSNWETQHVSCWLVQCQKTFHKHHLVKAKLEEWFSVTWKMIAGKAVELLFRKRCITNALHCIEDANLWNSSEIGYLDLKINLECENECMSEEDIDFKFLVFLDLYLLIQEVFLEKVLL
jgi:hypothetical protein